MKVKLELSTDTGLRITGDTYSFDFDPDAMQCYLTARNSLQLAYEVLEDHPEPVAAPEPVPVDGVQQQEPVPDVGHQQAPRVAYGRQVTAREHTE